MAVIRWLRKLKVMLGGGRERHKETVGRDTMVAKMRVKLGGGRENKNSLFVAALLD